jgi:hypothetical protein
MKISALLLTACSTLALSATLVAPASADFPGRHPFYVHAMGDLRYAHALLDHGDYRPGVDGQEDAALDDIRTAYGAIERAGFDDGKDVDDHLIDRGINRRGRLRRALEALQRAHFDVARQEDARSRAATSRATSRAHWVARALEPVVMQQRGRDGCRFCRRHGIGKRTSVLSKSLPLNNSTALRSAAIAYAKQPPMFNWSG